MTIVFVGGSRRIKHLPVEAKTRLENVVSKGLPILIGDADGADKAVQEHLSDLQYKKVSVYCSGDTCRNNIGKWKTCNVNAGNQQKNFQFYAVKDREMAHHAKFGLMIWDGHSPGTILNILRLVKASKMAVLVSVAQRSEMEFKSKNDWDDFLSGCSWKLRRDMEKRAIQDELFMLRPEQECLNMPCSDEFSLDGRLD